MNRLIVLMGLGCLLWAGPAAAQDGGDFVQPEPAPPEGEPLRQDRDAWLIDVRAAFPGGLPIGGDAPLQELYIYRRGLVSLDGVLPERLVAQPRALLAVEQARLIAPFWADLDPTGCRTARGDNAVYVLTEPDRLEVTWHEVVPAGCPALVRPASFALRIGPVADGVVHIEFRYLAVGEPGAYHPRAGLVLGAAMELFRAPGPDEAFAVPRDRAKALFDGSSDGEPGVWRFEVDAGGGLMGDFDHDGVRDGIDNCWTLANPLQSNLDAEDDGDGDVCDDDDDQDDENDTTDNCPRVWNADQSDLDWDGLGDACDADRDGDGTPNRQDNCPDHHQWRQLDLDRDGQGDVCDADVDGDDEQARRADGRIPPENCPGVHEPLRKDTDRDGLGDACDLTPRWPCAARRCPAHSDWDGDGVDDLRDVCPYWPDPDQLTYKDGAGMACSRLRFVPLREALFPEPRRPNRIPFPIPLQ